nr:MAG TPA: hypothetical protein [Caudoviricetes sp.]
MSGQLSSITTLKRPSVSSVPVLAQRSRISSVFQLFKPFQNTSET